MNKVLEWVRWPLIIWGDLVDYFLLEEDETPID